VSNIHGPQLFVWAGKDNHILPEHVQTVTDTMKQADKDFINVNISYAEHAFFNADRAAYHKDASAEAWGITKAFFENKLKN
ncbi:MAG: dienelactone hydrolase family protein, partial [Bacteroidota bacterium]